MTEVEPRDDAPSGASAATRSVPKRSDTTSTMGESADRHLEDAKVWQIIVSFLWLAVGWAFVVSLFSQQFSIGDNVVSFLLRATTGNYTGLPCKSCSSPALVRLFLAVATWALIRLRLTVLIPCTRAVGVFGVCVCTFLLLYVLDISYWRGPLGVILRRVCTIGFCILVAIYAMLSFNDYPYLPLAVAMLTLPVMAYMLQSSIYRNVKPSQVRSRPACR